MEIVIIVVVVVVAFMVFMFNTLIKANNKVKEAFSTMDVYLKKRWDLIPNIVETVKGYAGHEKGTLEKIAALRTNAYDSMSNKEKLDSGEQLRENIVKIMAIAENYPELKASENFQELSKELVSIEDEIANSRKYYNAVVREYNNKVEMFPGNIIAGALGYKTYSMFEANQEEKENIEIDLTKE